MTLKVFEPSKICFLVIFCDFRLQKSELQRNGWTYTKTTCERFVSISSDFLFLRATAECFARFSHRLGVCPFVRLSVRLSVTLVICIKMVQARITKFPLWLPQRL